MRRELTAERLIGWLTVAMGTGLIPALSASVSAWVLGVAPVVIGSALIIASYTIDGRRLRIGLLLLVAVIWLTLAVMALDSIWVFQAQAVVVIVYCNKLGWALWHDRKK